MKIFIYVLLWSVIWFIAFTIKVFLGGFLDGVEIARAIRALIMAIPTGLCVGIGTVLHNKLKRYFKNSVQKV